MTKWFYRGVGQMTMCDHDGEGGVKIFEILTTRYMDAPSYGLQQCFSTMFLYFKKSMYRQMVRLDHSFHF